MTTIYCVRQYLGVLYIYIYVDTYAYRDTTEELNSSRRVEKKRDPDEFRNRAGFEGSRVRVYGFGFSVWDQG